MEEVALVHPLDPLPAVMEVILKSLHLLLLPIPLQVEVALVDLLPVVIPVVLEDLAEVAEEEVFPVDLVTPLLLAPLKVMMVETVLISVWVEEAVVRAPQALPLDRLYRTKEMVGMVHLHQ